MHYKVIEDSSDNVPNLNALETKMEAGALHDELGNKYDIIDFSVDNGTIYTLVKLYRS